MKAYEGLPWILKIILQIFLGYFVSIIYRILGGLKKKNMVVLVVGIVTIFFPILWIVDLITIILSNKITVLA